MKALNISLALRCGGDLAATDAARISFGNTAAAGLTSPADMLVRLAGGSVQSVCKLPDAPQPLKLGRRMLWRHEAGLLIFIERLAKEARR